MRWRWLLFGVIAALAGTAAILGARLGEVRAERDVLRVQERKSESRIGKLSAEILALKTQVGELTFQRESDKDALAELQAKNYNDWQRWAAPASRAAADFEPLKQAQGVILHDGSPAFTREGEQVERAVRELSGALPLGPIEGPLESQILVRLEFVGIPDGTVLLMPNIAYFRGKGYFFPELGRWFPTMMNAN